MRLPPDPSPAPPLPMQRFASHELACAALAGQVAADLERAVIDRGTASVALSGGTSPGEFLVLLGRRRLDWQRIVVTLADERWVAPGHERSNAGLVARTLGLVAHPYTWFPLWRADTTAEAAVSQIEIESAVIDWPLDVVVLGMGEDGHVASLFPDSEAGFGETGQRRYVAVMGPGDEPRISLSLSAIAGAGSVYLLLKGRHKQTVLQAAVGGNLPVARVLAARQGSIHVYASD